MNGRLNVLPSGGKVDALRAEKVTPLPREVVADDPLRDAVIAAISEVYDPEIPVNLYELGLIYDVAIDHAAKHARVTMTLTAPACPVADKLPADVKRKVEEVAGVDRCDVTLTFDPPWTKARMSEAALLELGLL